jgi:RimJ/RimL family protein N-acetyltransferase
MRVDRAPIVETGRLRLRAHTIDDFEACVAMWTDPAVFRYIGGKASMRGQVWSRILAYAGHWTLMGFGYWAVDSRETGGYVGELGFADFKREMTPSLAGKPELGWALVSAASGRGFATEALRAAAAWGDANLAALRTTCIVDAENLASLRVAAKIGFRQTVATAFNERRTLVLERDRAGTGLAG